ncbi:MAG: hypothetical protein HYZ35_06180 [Chloroflexi bacterium]|nr:hypothetical protein [Chloroflexota bacterium]
MFSYQYDGDGNRVKQVHPDGTFTIYIAGLYEASYASTGTLLNTKVYYAFGGKVVAMRDNSTLYYLHTDHLGSTRVVTDGNGQAVSLNAYYPFGASKYTSGACPDGALSKTPHG